ncbi:uncharacterized protein LOC120214179 [Hibiscus syriacus]|uniref:uncharacterized protein LOC120214179 n=1 Tax=Hibiscus syriacus TaxID=106335 RepID=UPI001920649B|nr:uncharacterized protein LOC120214179 [Hibiscus syriacus]
MSNKVPEEIDLNCDAVPVHQENERSDVNVGQPVSGLATTETVLAAGLDELEKESKIESVKSQGIDLEADVGSLGEVVDDKVSAGLSSGGASLMRLMEEEEEEEELELEMERVVPWKTRNPWRMNKWFRGLLVGLLRNLMLAPLLMRTR